jgi:ubiquitin conjugation factor E4 A
MCDDINSNPFAGLFATNHEATAFTSLAEVADNIQNESVNLEKDCIIEVEIAKQSLEVASDSNESEKLDQLEKLIANVFGITLHQQNLNTSTQQLVFIDTDSIEHAIFERLLLTDPISLLISKENIKEINLDHHFIQTEIVAYLFESYCRLQKYRICNGSYDIVENIRIIIMRNISTALQEPEIFIDQEVCIYITVAKFKL